MIDDIIISLPQALAVLLALSAIAYVTSEVMNTVRKTKRESEFAQAEERLPIESEGLGRTIAADMLSQGQAVGTDAAREAVRRRFDDLYAISTLNHDTLRYFIEELDQELIRYGYGQNVVDELRGSLVDWRRERVEGDVKYAERGSARLPAGAHSEPHRVAALFNSYFANYRSQGFIVETSAQFVEETDGALENAAQRLRRTG